MTRSYCKQPHAYVARKHGPCRLCSDLSHSAALASARMRKLNADPAFAAANAERMRKYSSAATKTERNAAIVAASRAGLSLAEIGRRMKLSRQRIAQIVQRAELAEMWARRRAGVGRAW